MEDYSKRIHALLLFSLYRTSFRPKYRIAYKTVTELEWRCCPGFMGVDCKEAVPQRPRPVVYPAEQPPNDMKTSLGNFFSASCFKEMEMVAMQGNISFI
ncbi:EMILIN-2 [Varanus komodoensis]|nr:EMILIN-2 [Varanus komodoensis]